MIMYGHPTSEDSTHQTSAIPYTEFDFMDLVTRLSQGCDSLKTRLSQLQKQGCHSYKNKVVTTFYNLDFFVWVGLQLLYVHMIYLQPICMADQSSLR